MASGGANTVPLATPYKMGKFDLSHRFALAPCPLLFGWAKFPISQIPLFSKQMLRVAGQFPRPRKRFVWNPPLLRVAQQGGGRAPCVRRQSGQSSQRCFSLTRKMTAMDGIRSYTIHVVIFSDFIMWNSGCSVLLFIEDQVPHFTVFPFSFFSPSFALRQVESVDALQDAASMWVLSVCHQLIMLTPNKVDGDCNYYAESERFGWGYL